MSAIFDIVTFLLAMFGFFATVLFKMTTLRCPSPKDDERIIAAAKRLGIVYWRNLRVAVSSSYFWAGAGLMTAIAIVMEVYK